MPAPLRIGAFLSALATGAACLALLLGGTTSASSAPGDANCDGRVDSIDAAIVLQHNAGLVATVGCSQKADVNGDGRVDSRDAALILQYQAGLIPSLGTPHGPTPTRTGTPAGTATPAPPTPTNTPLPPPPTPPPTATPCPDVCPTPTPTQTLVPPTPLPGVDFSIAIDVDSDGQDDCTTQVPGLDTCTISDGAAFTLKVMLNALPPDLESYNGFDLRLRYDRVTLNGDPSASAWPDCMFQAHALEPPDGVSFACAIDVPPAPGSTYTGVIGTANFTGACEGTVALVHGSGNADLIDDQFRMFVEAQSGEETLNLAC